jgi:UDP-3-O-[3-hydroxymyristoyl] glucosamine N-acyltransferase
MSEVKLKDIVKYLKNEIVFVSGEVENICISDIANNENQRPDTIDWINTVRGKKQELTEKAISKVILCDESIIYSDNIKKSSKTLIHVKNPKMAFALIANKYFIKQYERNIHETVIIHKEAIIGKKVFIGSNCNIGKCIIGENTFIYPGVTILEGVKIGKNVVIQAGSIVGSDGLGCERKNDGTLIKFPHFGGVFIGDNVEIGANCVITKGALSDTTIKKGCKINAQCYIAHNCNIGKNVWISPQSGLAGSVVIEDNATIYSNVIVREKIMIGKGAVIGMGSVVTKNIPSGETWIGNPAKKLVK